MDEKLWWYLSRATGLVAWALAVASILLGLALASRALGKKPPAPWLLALHRWTGGLTIAFTLGHVGALVGDSFVHFGWADVLVPFASEWRSTAVAWGVIAMWLLVAIELTSLQMRRLPKRLWRAVHLSSYLVAVLATVHGFAAGTDTRSGAFAWVAVAAIGSMAFFAMYRALAPIKGARARRASARSASGATSATPRRADGAAPEQFAPVAEQSRPSADDPAERDGRRAPLAGARAHPGASSGLPGPIGGVATDRRAALAAARARLQTAAAAGAADDGGGAPADEPVDRRAMLAAARARAAETSS